MNRRERPWPENVAASLGAPVRVDRLSPTTIRALDPLAGCRVVLSVWSMESAAPAVTFDRLAELAVRYSLRLGATGVPSLTAATAKDAAAFVHAPTSRGAPPAVHTMHLRRTVLRSIYRTLHRVDPTVGDPTAYLELPSRWYRTQRPLTDTELRQLRVSVAARRGDPPAGTVLLALAEAGASTAELTTLRWNAVLDDDTLALPGVTRVLPRVVSLTDWGVSVVAQARRAGVDPLALIVPTASTKPPGSQPAIAAMTNRLRQLLRTAELHTIDGIGPRSIRLWGALRAYRASNQVDDAAAVLGMRSLDRAAAAICLDELHHLHERGQ